MAEKIQARPLFSGRELTALLWPLVVEQLLAVTVGMADVVMVSSAGEAAVSGVSLVDMINVLIINIFAALATGGAVVTSQLIGARKPQRACQSAWQLVWVSGLLGLAVAALALVFSKGLIRLFFGSITDDVFDACMIYLCISAVSYPFLAVYNSCAALFRSMGNSRISMQVSMGMNLFNIAGNAVGVYLLHLGVAGVALPTLISRAGACVVMLVRLRDPHLPVTLAGQRRWQPDFALIRNILHIGIPSALENSMFQLGRVLVVSIISAFGTVQIAANAVANNLDSLGCIPGQAVSLAVITVVGQCIGAGDRRQATGYAKKLVGIAYLAMIALNTVILLTLSWTLKMYNVSAETLQLSTWLVFIHDGFAMLLWPVAFVLPGALRAAGDVRFTMVVSVFSMWAFRILFSWILGSMLGWGAIGVWVAMLLDWVFRAAFFLWRFFSGRWLRHSALV